jgi:hypothetical protein
MNKLPLLLAALALPGVATAGGAMHAGPELSYTFIDAGYLAVKPDDSNLDFKGFTMSGQALISEQLFVFGGYSRTESDSFSYAGSTASFINSGLSAGLGVRLPLEPRLDLEAGAAFEWAKVEGSGALSGDNTDTGYSLRAGLRGLLTDQLELNGGVGYSKIRDTSETSWIAGLVYSLTPAWGLQGGYTANRDAKAWTAGARVNFGG